MVFLKLHSYANIVAAILWGLWLLPFGILGFRSGFIPRILGVLVTQITLLPEAAGELSMIFWLLIKGAKAQPLNHPLKRAPD